MNLDGIAKSLGQIAPGHSRAIPIKHGIDEQPIIASGHAYMFAPSGQQILDAIPLIVAKSITAQGQPPIRLTPYELYDPIQGNPAIEDRP